MTQYIENIFEHYKKTGYLHHAHVVVGAHSAVIPALLFSIEEHLGIKSKGNPDITTYIHESFGIDEARALKNSQHRAGFGTARKIFIIGANSITTEAQNALLKTLEEPTEGTHFFIILPRAEMLLPTLRSRVLVVSGAVAALDDVKLLAEKFLDATLEERFAIAKKMSDKKDRETIDRESFRSLFDHIERILYTRTAGNRGDATGSIFHEIFQAKTYLSNPGSSPKMLLEHIAIMLSH